MKYQVSEKNCIQIYYLHTKYIMENVIGITISTHGAMRRAWDIYVSNSESEILFGHTDL